MTIPELFAKPPATLASRHYRERYAELAEMEREARAGGWTYYADEVRRFALIALTASRAEVRQ